MKRLPPRWRSAFLLALLAVVVAAAPRAALRVVWRNSLLSFDSPASQVLDELATQKAPCADPLLEADRALRVAATSARRLWPREHVLDQRSPGLSGLEARAPPSA